MRRITALVFIGCQACVVLGSVSCAGDDPTFPSDPTPTPPFEPVAFDAIGSGKVMFQRTSASGTFIAVYLIDAGARRTSTVLDRVGSGLAGNVFGPSISPTGDEVALRRWTDFESCYNVYTTDLTGRAPRQLSSSSDGFACNTEGDPSWTPSGTAVVFPGELDRVAGIYQRVLTTDALIALRTFTAEPDAFTGCVLKDPVSVSARDGLAYACAREGIYGAESPSDLLMSLYGTTSSDARVYSPAWSPNGSDLAFLEVLRSTDGLILSTSLKVLELASGTVRTVAVVQGSGEGTPFFARGQELLGHRDVRTTMIYTHVLNRPGLGVQSPADSL